MSDDDYVPLTETPLWKRARRARGGPRGAHIKKEIGADGLVEMSREEQIEAWLLAQKENGMVISGVKFDKSISVGALAGMVMTIISWGAAYGVFTRWQGDVENKIASNTSAITANLKGDEDRSHRYIPQIEAMQRVTDMTGDRFMAVNSSLNQLREITADLAKTVAQNNAELSRVISQTHEEVMVLKARLGYDKRTELRPGDDRKEP